jgi:hypothetical protein
MTALASTPATATNRYLVTSSGRFVGSRTRPLLGMLGGFVGAPLLAMIGGAVGGVLDVPVVTILFGLLGFFGFFAAVIAQWVFLLGGQRELIRSANMWLAGDNVGPIALCHKPLARVFRSDIRMRALYTLGLCAEANGDFAEADDLFLRAYDAVPAMAASKWKRHGQCMMLSHRAIALVALNRLAEADAMVRQASLLFPPVAAGMLDLISDDAAFGAIGVAAALRDLEPGRDRRALLTLATVVVLTANGMARESLELVERERYPLMAGLMPREKSLLANVEVRSRGLLAAGPMRTPGLASPSDAAGSAWADRILPITR